MGKDRSKAQWRFLFATGKAFARRWAHSAGSFASLPSRIGSKGGGGKKGGKKGKR